jgi:hypothetical protein
VLPRRQTPVRRRSARPAAAATALAGGLAALVTLTGLTTASASAAPAVAAGARHLTPPTSPRVPAKISPSWTAAAVGPSVPLPVFSKSFTTGGQTFTYRMVGSDPQGAAATTTVPDTVTPLQFVFLGEGRSMGVPATTLAQVTGSGLFVPAGFPGGTGQYGDIFMRTQFWTWIDSGAKDWHVNLATPTVQPVLTVSVPAADGNTVVVNGVRVGLVDITWFDQTIQSVIGTPAENVFTQLLADNIVLCDAGQCGIGGYHSASTNATGTHTYSYQSFLDAAIFGSTFADTAPMSHELAEWLADPFVDNTVPFWDSPIAPQYPCNNFLEVGDPLVGIVQQVGGLSFQDEAFISFFTRDVPSIGWLNRYSWFGTFTSPSPSCTP